MYEHEQHLDFYNPDLCMNVPNSISNVHLCWGVGACVCMIGGGGDSGMDRSHSMRHSSKNAIPTKPQKQLAIAQNFHIKIR